MFDFKDEEDGMEDFKEFIFQATDKKIEEAQKKLGQDLFNSLSNDIEEWMYERFDNVRRRYFDDVVAFLLNKDNVYVRDKETLDEWFASVGYDQTNFRKKIYQDNKEIINEALANDAIYERMKMMFESGYFRSWNFTDISKGYPQSDLVRNFLHNLLEKNGFDEYVESMLNDKIKQRKRELDNLKEDLIKIQKQIEEIENNY